MKRTLVAAIALLVAVSGFAQTDTTKSSSDTVRVGNFIIVKKAKKGDGDRSVDVTYNSRKKKVLSTNWWIFDLGFTNINDKTDYGFAQSGSYLKSIAPGGPITENSMKLKAGKSSNVNIWILMQKLNISKKIVNLKYGVGLEMYNFRYQNNISYRRDAGGNPYVYNDSVDFSKNKLYAGYLTVPLMLNINTRPGKTKGLSFSAGVSAGYLIASRNKQVSDERGKVKYKGDFNLEPFRLAAVSEVGIGPIRLYGSYSLNKLHEGSTRLDQHPYTVGIRFSNW